MLKQIRSAGPVRKSRLIIVAGLAVLAGVIVVSIFAAGSPIAFEAESGVLAGGSALATPTGASGTGAVKFASATPAPTSTPTPTTVPSGYPNASNTGPAAAGYTNLTPHAGGWTISASGTYSGLNVSGEITISANNVILQGCDVHGPSDYNLIVVTGSNVQILDCNIHGDGPTTAQAPQNSWIEVRNSGFTMKRCNLWYSSGDGVRQVGAPNFTVEDSYIHDWVQNPTNAPHIDGITEGNDGPMGPITIRHNTVLMWSNDGLTNVLSFAAGNNTLHDVIVDNNLLAGGGYVIHGGGDTIYNNLSFTNNKFSIMFSPNVGQWGIMRNAPVWSVAKGTYWTNNSYYDGANAGKIIPEP